MGREAETPDRDRERVQRTLDSILRDYEAASPATVEGDGEGEPERLATPKVQAVRSEHRGGYHQPRLASGAHLSRTRPPRERQPVVGRRWASWRMLLGLAAAVAVAVAVLVLLSRGNHSSAERAVAGSTSGDRPAIEHTVVTYLQAVSAGDGQTACDLLTPAQARAVYLGGLQAFPDAHLTSCAQVIAFVGPRTSPAMKAVARDAAKIFSVIHVTGDRATADFHGGSNPIALVKTGRRWFVAGGGLAH